MERALGGDGSLPRFMQLGLILVGGYRVMSGEISIGTLVAIPQFEYVAARWCGKWLGNAVTAFSQTATAAVRIFELLDERVMIESPTASSPCARSSLQRKKSNGAARLSTERSISFLPDLAGKDAGRYQSMHSLRGSSLAAVGATGSGKSTLIHLIGRFYDPTSRAGLDRWTGCTRPQLDRVA